MAFTGTIDDHVTAFVSDLSIRDVYHRCSEPRHETVALYVFLHRRHRRQYLAWAKSAMQFVRRSSLFTHQASRYTISLFSSLDVCLATLTICLDTTKKKSQSISCNFLEGRCRWLITGD